MKTRIIPIFVPHKGCPHDCIFCNQKKITGVSTDVTKEDAKNIINEYLKTIDTNCNVEIAFFGGSFTAIDVQVQRDLLGIAKEYKDMGIVDNIRLSTRPDCITEDILSMLKEYGVSIIELGVQSLDINVLNDSYRGHDDIIVSKSAQMIKEYGFELGLQMMLGLPGDTKQKSLYTAKEFVKMKPSFVRIYPTLVVKDTHLEKLYKSGEYAPFDIETTVDVTKELLVLFKKNNITVIRVGLQPTEDIQLGREILSGPYHPSIREIIESRIFRDYMELYIKKNNVLDELIINCNKKLVSKLIGNKKSNVEYIKGKYNIKLKIIDTKMDETYLCLNNEKYCIDGIYDELFHLYKLG